MILGGAYPQAPGYRNQFIQIGFIPNGSIYPESGGPRTQQERKDQAVVDEVRKDVKERLRNSMISSLQSLQSQFEKLDASGDGLLNQQELIGALQRAGIELNNDQIDSVWRIVDEDQV